MRGRPRKAYLEQDTPVTTTVRIKKGVREMLPKDQNLSEIVEMAITGLFSDKRESAIEEQGKKVRALEIELARAKLVLNELEAARDKEEKIRKALRIEERYPAVAFRMMIQWVRRNNPRASRINLGEDAIAKKWGIELDMEKLNSDYEDFIIDFEEGRLGDDVVQKYHVRKAASKSLLESEIRSEVEKEVGLR